MLSRGALISALVSIFLMPAILLVCEPLFQKTSYRWKTPEPAPALSGSEKEMLPAAETKTLPASEEAPLPASSAKETPAEVVFTGKEPVSTRTK